MAESNLDSIVYVSSAVRLLTLKEINHLLQRARERNIEYEVTGVLLYIGGNFMQYLEGPKDSLDIIYRIIEEDEQHTGIILISREDLERRQLGDWSMAYQTKDVEGFVSSPSNRQLNQMIMEIPEEEPSTARIVLHKFWEQSGSKLS
jgi:hypothetical protein